MPIGAIFKFVIIMAMVGFAVAALIGAAIVVVPIIIVGAGVYIYIRRTRW